MFVEPSTECPSFMHHTRALLRLRFIHYNTIVWVKLTHLEQKTFVHKSWVKPFKTKIMVQLSKAIWFKPRHFKDNFSKFLINYNYNYSSSTMVPLSLTYMPSRNFWISLFFTWHFCKTNKRLGQQVQITYNWNDCTFFSPRKFLISMDLLLGALPCGSSPLACHALSKLIYELGSKSLQIQLSI